MYPAMRNDRRKCESEIDIRHDQPGCDCHFPASLSNSDCPQKFPMPIHRPIETTQSCAILALRLLQIACIILHSLVRLITSDNDIASIMDMMPVSISRVIGSSFDHATLARWLCFTILWAEHERRWSRHGPKESLILWRGEATGGLPHAPLRASSQCGNPSPHKNSYFLCQ